MSKAILLTVGTGNVDDVENSLLTPLRKAIKAQGDGWDRVILLPSQVTIETAQILEAELKAEVRPLPGERMEDDPDACFRHFEGVIEKLRQDGFAPEDIHVDFTRGTKVMSAALVLAAIAHEIPQLQYITGPRDNRGQVIAGREQVRDAGASGALALRRIEQARGLVAGGAYAAALAVLPEEAEAGVLPRPEELPRMRALAAFLAAWDRLDYATAAKMTLPARQELPTNWRELCPGADFVDWVTRLADQPSETDPWGMARWLRPLMIDLLANAERRVRHHQFEDALVRSYRVLELVGQARLFDHGLDSARLRADHPAVQALCEKIEKRKQHPLGRNSDGTLNAGRDKVAGLLAELGDPLGGPLKRFDEKHAGLKAKLRNHSVLVHGFRARAASDGQSWRDMLDALWDLLKTDRADDPEGFVADVRLVRATGQD